MERAERIEPGIPERPEAATRVEVQIGRGDGVDAGVIERIEDLERTTGVLSGRAGLPADLLRQTLEGLQQNFEAAQREGFFEGMNERALQLLQRGLEAAINKFGGEQVIGEFKGTEWNPIWGAMLQLSDIINRRFVPGRERGIIKEAEEFVTRLTRGAVRTEEMGEEGGAVRAGLTHPALERLSEEVYRALGKEPITELRHYETIDGRRRLMGIMDVMASFQMEGAPDLRGYHVTEVATGFAGLAKERQMANYINLMVDYAYRESHGLPMDEEVDPGLVDEWLKGIAQQYYTGEEDRAPMFKAGMLYTRGVSPGQMEGIVKRLMRQRVGLREMLQAEGMFEFVPLKIPEEVLLEAFEKYDPEQDEPGDMAADILNSLKGMDMWNEVIAFFNPEQRPIGEIDATLSRIIQTRLERLQAEGRRPDDLTLDDAEDILGELAEATGATRTDVFRVGDRRQWNVSRRTRPGGSRPSAGVRYRRTRASLLDELIDRLGMAWDVREEVEPEAEDVIAAIGPEAPIEGPVTEGITMEIDWREYLKGMRKYARAIQEEFDIEMDVQRYLEWGVARARGFLPPEIRQTVEGMVALTAEMQRAEGLQNIPEMMDAAPNFMRVVYRIMQLEEGGGAGVNRDEIMGMLTAEVAPELEVLRERFPNWYQHLERSYSDVSIAMSEAEAFEKVHSRLEPATTLMTVRNL